MVATERKERFALLAKISVGVGVMLFLCTGRAEKLPDTTIAGAVGVGLAVVALAYLVVEAGTRGRGAQRPPVGSAAAVALFAGAVLVIAAGIGVVARYVFPYEYAVHYGDRTTVTRSDDCTEREFRRVRSANHSECPNSTWQIDGQTRTGTLMVSWKAYDEPGAREQVPERIEANVIGDRAYSIPREKDRTFVAAWGGVPLWLLLVGLPIAAVALLVLHRLGRLPGKS